MGNTIDISNLRNGISVQDMRKGTLFLTNDDHLFMKVEVNHVGNPVIDVEKMYENRLAVDLTTGIVYLMNEHKYQVVEVEVKVNAATDIEPYLKPKKRKKND